MKFLETTVCWNLIVNQRFFGEPVVEACVEGGAHHVDISGEPQYLEKMQLKYHQVTLQARHLRESLQKALENGVYVVGACGFDSIPADMGQVKKGTNFWGLNTAGVCEGRNGG